MKTIHVDVTAADLAEADKHPGAHWWAWPVQTALEGVIGADVDIDLAALTAQKAQHRAIARERLAHR